MKDKLFAERVSIEQVEEGQELAPKFDENGLIPVITMDFHTKDVLMLGYMNTDRFRLTLKTKQAHYYSRSRDIVWHKGETSGLIQHVKELRIDDDQDSLWMIVEVEGSASCHVGYRSCFYREIKNNNQEVSLEFTELEKVFDPEEVYPGVDNPTKL
mgnify:CR=1 FL=1